MVFGGGAGAVDLGSAYGVIGIGFDEANINNALSRVESTISGRLQSLGSQFMNLGSQLTLAFAPLSVGMGASLASFVEFDDILTEISARTGATADQMEVVRQTALQMGQDTAFSAKDASSAMLELLSSGYDLDQTLQALEPTLTLATVGNLALGQAADTVTDILAQYRLGVDQAAMVTDVLARAAGASSADVADLAQSFGNVGPVAANAGLSVEQTAAILAVFAENGIKGAEAGTQLKSMLTNLYTNDDAGTMLDRLNVSLTDSEGNFRDFNDVLKDLHSALYDTQTVTVRVNNLTSEQSALIDEAQKAYANASRNVMLYGNGLKGTGLDQEQLNAKIAENQQIMANAENVIASTTGSLGEAQYITRELNRTEEDRFKIINELAGSYGQMGLSALLAYGDLDPMTALMAEQANAADIAQEKMNSFGGVLDQVGSTAETIMLNIWQAMKDKYLLPLANAVLTLVNAFNNYLQQNPQIAEALGILLAVLSVIGPVIWGIGAAISALGFVLGALLSPVALVVAAIVGLAVAWKNNFLGIRNVVQPVIDNIVGKLDLLYKQLQFVYAVGGIREVLNFAGVGDTILPIIDYLEQLYNQLAFIMAIGDAGDVFQFLVDEFNRLWEKLGANGPQIAEKLGTAIGDAMTKLGELLIEYGPTILGGLVMALDWVFTTAIPEINRMALVLGLSFLIGFIQGFDASMLLGQLLALMTEAITYLTPLAQELLASVLNAVAGAIASAVPWAQGAVADVLNTLSGLLGDASNTLMMLAGIVLFYLWQASNYIRDQFQAGYDAATGKLEELKTSVSNKLTEIKDDILTKMLDIALTLAVAWQDAKTAVEGKLAETKAAVEGKFNEVKSSVISKMLEIGLEIAAAWTNAKTAVINTLTTLVSDAKAKWDEIKNDITTKATELYDSAMGMGQDIVAGLKAGIEAAWDGFVAYLQEQYDSLPGVLKTIMGIGSPSKVMAELAYWIPEGIKVGIEDNMGAPLDALRQMAELMAAPSVMAPAFASATAPVSAPMVAAPNTTTSTSETTTHTYNTYYVTVQDGDPLAEKILIAARNRT